MFPAIGPVEQLYRHDKSPTAMALAGFRVS